MAYIADFHPTGYKQTVIYCHGNGDTLKYLSPMLESHSKIYGVRYVGFDWKGYGQCAGKPSESNI